MKKYCVLVAGGTGGHINAAIALGERLSLLGYEVDYLTGQRPLDYKLFKNKNAIHLSSWPLRTSNPFKLLASLVRNFIVFLKIWLKFFGRKPSFVIGAGGYVCGPTLLAAKLVGSPIFIVEQNAVMGVTNRYLARVANLIFVHFKNTKNLPEGMYSKTKVVGNPIRQSIKFTAPLPTHKPLRVLVFGGSLGATQINKAIDSYLKNNPDLSLEIVHQTGSDENISQDPRIKKYKYLDEIQENYNWCDVIVARAGASTVAELRIVAKPALLIPFPAATDNHQWWNALSLRDEKRFTVEVFDPKDTDGKLLDQLNVFLRNSLQGLYHTSHSVPQVVDSGEALLSEIFQYVGITQKT